MNHSRAANLSIALAIVGWSLATWGCLRQLGDPSPTIPRSELIAARDVSMTFVFGGGSALLAALWLSGYCFTSTRWRASATMLLCLTPIAWMFGHEFMLRVP